MSFSRLGLKKGGAADAVEKIAGYFERILVSGGRLTSLVDDLLNLAKLESGDVSLTLSVVDIGHVVGEAGATLEALLMSRGQTLKIA